MRISKMAVIAYVLAILICGKEIDAVIGMIWGRSASNGGFVPTMAVDLLLQNKIKEVKIYSSDDNVLKAFAGSGIGVTISINLPQLITSPYIAREFVKTKVYENPNLLVRYILVGNNAFGSARFSHIPYSTIVTALRYINDALSFFNLNGRTKAVLSHSYASVLQINPRISRPSEAEFVDGVKEAMAEVLSIANQTNAPFVFDIFPITFVFSWGLDPEFAMFDNKSGQIITDVNGLQYTNLFDFVYDCFVWAVRKAGYPDIKIVIGQIGWPTDGYMNANIPLAERYLKGLLTKVSSNQGTPMRPGASIDVYIHSLTDEKSKYLSLPFARHWGIYRANGKPKYKVDLTGQGREIYPTSVRGLHLMPARWCVFNGDDKNHSLVQEQFDLACDSLADCTPLEKDGSCGILKKVENVSFAFNSYFQSHYQDEKACEFQGLGMVTSQDPSRDGCIFSIEIVRGVQQPDISKW